MQLSFPLLLSSRQICFPSIIIRRVLSFSSPFPYIYLMYLIVHCSAGPLYLTPSIHSVLFSLSRAQTTHTFPSPFIGLKSYHFLTKRIIQTLWKATPDTLSVSSSSESAKLLVFIENDCPLDIVQPI